MPANSCQQHARGAGLSSRRFLGRGEGAQPVGQLVFIDVLEEKTLVVRAHQLAMHKRINESIADPPSKKRSREGDDVSQGNPHGPHDTSANVYSLY